MAERYVFANQLRGIAACCVVISHLAGVFWTTPLLVAQATHSPVLTVAVPAFAGLFAGPWYNTGPFGVALFFLISGFVIPMSLERQSVLGFLVARFFRIYPPYVVAFTVELAVVALSAGYWHVPFKLDVQTMLVNALLLNDVMNTPSIDLVSWTLMVELKFYLLMALLAGLIRRALVAPLRVFEMNALYVLFMLIGVVFSYHARGRIGGTRATASIAVLFAAFVACWPLTFFRGGFPTVTYNYGWALAVFGSAYLARHAIRDSRVANFFASVSYPLYLVHALVGFVVMRIAIAAGMGAIPAVLVAAAVATGLAYVLHVAVEAPSQAFGKKMAAAFKRRTAAVSST